MCALIDFKSLLIKINLMININENNKNIIISNNYKNNMVEICAYISIKYSQFHIIMASPINS